MFCTRIMVDTSMLVPCSMFSEVPPSWSVSTPSWNINPNCSGNPSCIHRLETRGSWASLSWSAPWTPTSPSTAPRSAYSRHGRTSSAPFPTSSRTTQSTSTARLCSSRERLLSVFSPGYPCSSPPRLLHPPGGHPGQVPHHRHGTQLGQHQRVLRDHWEGN